MLNSTDLVVWTIIFGAECCVIVVGNTFTIAVFWKQRSFLRHTCYILINLSIADGLVGLSAIETVVTNIIRLRDTEPVLSEKYFVLDKYFATASMTFLVLISLERFYAVAWPFRHRITTTRTYAYWIGTVWCYSGLATFVSSLSDFVSEPFLSEACAWIVTSLVGLGVILISCAYYGIWIYSNKENPRLPQNRREQNKRLAKTLFIVTLLSIVTWLPFGVIYILPYSVGQEYISLHVIFTGRLLQLTSSAVNPIVYCFRMPEFRNTLNKIFNERKCLALHTGRGHQQQKILNVPVLLSTSRGCPPQKMVHDYEPAVIFRYNLS